MTRIITAARLVTVPHHRVVVLEPEPKVFAGARKKQGDQAPVSSSVEEKFLPNFYFFEGK